MPTLVSLKPLWLALVACALAACPSTGIYRTADPVAPGEWRLSGAAGVGVYKDVERESKIPTVPVSFGARYGLRENLDLGARLYASGLQLSATWRVYHQRWSLALAPSISGTRFIETAVTVDSINLFAGLQGIASRPLSPRWTIAMGPTTGWGLYYPETGGHAQGAWVGAYAYLEATLGSKWRIGPELGGYAVVSGQVPVDGGYLHFALSVKRDL